MEKSDFGVKFYDLADGTKPAKDFVLELPKKMRAKVYRAEYMGREESKQ